MGKNRLEGLDYLRGLAAFGIMIFHFTSWKIGEHTAHDMLLRIGIYGVSIFYVLSGLTLYYVYYDKINGFDTGLKDFYIKRIFRIFPLLWTIIILYMVIYPGGYSATKIFLNLTGLFGLVDWNNYIGVGVWSIGNELVFYLLFPFLIFAAKWSKGAFTVLSTVFVSIYAYFTFFYIDPSLDSSEQWHIIINPLNQVIYFLGGFAMGLFLERVKISNAPLLVLLAIAVAAFVFYPVNSDNGIILHVGFNRVVFTSICFITCFCFYKINFNLTAFLSVPLKKLGEASYSVYLAHPLVLKMVTMVFLYAQARVFKTELPKALLIVTSVIATLVVAYLSFITLEKYFMNLGKKVSKRMAPIKPREQTA